MPRDARSLPVVTGTAVVRGRVVSADGRPVKRVPVVLVPTGTSDMDFAATRGQPASLAPRSTMTDAQGQFAFERVAAGFYRLTARPGAYQAQYLSGSLGQKRSDQPGPPFELKDGQALTDATIVMPRSGVISGRVTDDDGEPIARVPVSTLFLAPGATNATRSGSAQTDDLVRYRLFGLQPGDYMPFADVRNNGNIDVDSDADPVGFMTTYFPGVASESEAQRVQVRAGAETSGIDFRLVRGRLFTISGAVLTSQGQPASQISVMVMRNLGRAEENVVNGFSTDAQGRFTMRNLTAGDYKLIVRPRMTRIGAIAGGDRAQDMAEFAAHDLHVDGDVSDLVITTRPTLTIAGRVVFEDGIPPAPPGAPDPTRALRILGSPVPGQMMSGPPSNAQVGADLAFTLTGLSGPVIVRAAGLPRTFIVKQVLVGSEDITDRPHEFTDRESGQLQIVASSRVAGLEGTVTDTGGKPAVDAIVVVLLEPRQGVHSAIYRSGIVDPRGQFRLPALRPGTFAVLAIPRERMPRPTDVDALDALAKDGQPIAIGDGEFKVIDLKLSGG